MSRYSALAILNGMGSVVPSMEDNDLNINIQAEHEGDGENEFDNNEFDADTSGDEVAGSEDTSSAVEAAELDTADAAVEVDEAVANVEDREEVVAGLENLMLTMARIAQSGEEITSTTRTLLAQNYAHVMRKHPKAMGTDVFSPSMEGMSHDAAVAPSMEAIGEKLKNAGKSIVAWFKEMWARFTEFVSSLFNGAKGSRKKAERLLNAAPGKAPEKVTYPAKYWSKVSDITAGSKELKEFMDILNVGRWLQIPNKASAGQDVVRTVVDHFTKENSTLISKFGGRNIVGYKLDGIDNVDGTLKIKSAPIGDDEATIKGTPLSEDEAKSVTRMVIDTLDSVLAYQKLQSARDKAVKEVSATLAKEASPSDAGAYAKWKLARQLAKAMAKQLAAEKTVASRTVSVCNMTLNIVAKSRGL